MIELKWFYFLLFNLFRRWPIKTDFVLTTLATRKQSQIFPQHIAPETPWQHVCDCFFFLKSSLFSIILICLQHFVQTMAKKEEKKQMISRNMSSIKNHMQVIPMSGNPGDKKGKRKTCFFFPMFVILCSFLFMSFHFFIFFIYFHFLHFFVIEKTIANLDHWHVDPLLSLADCMHSGWTFGLNQYFWPEQKEKIALCPKRAGSMVYWDQLDMLNGMDKGVHNSEIPEAQSSSPVNWWLVNLTGFHPKLELQIHRLWR